VRFVLVHGGFHGSWCWEKLAPYLEAVGHEVVAIDLPGAAKRMDEKASHASWRAAFREVVNDGDVLVGHSQGGFAAANRIFYHDCHPDDQARAFSRLTPLPLGPTLEPFVLPRFWTAPIPRDYILCTDDRSHTVASDNAFMRRLGLSTCMSIVSSHSPFISRPAETARLLLACAAGVLN
jgi:hypothetical protein